MPIVMHARVESDILQNSLLTLGQSALEHVELPQLLESTAALILNAIPATAVSIFELIPQVNILALKAQAGSNRQNPPNAHLQYPRNIPLGDVLTPDNLLDCLGAGPFEPKTDAGRIGLVIPGKPNSCAYGVIEIQFFPKETLTSDELNYLRTATSIVAAAILRCQLEDQLKSKVLNLHIANRKKDEFLATLSHELRAPLNVVLGYLNLIRDMEKNSPEFDHALEAIERNAKAESRLVCDILDVSRIITGKMTLELDSFPLLETFEFAWNSLMPAARAKEIQLSVACDPGIGQLRGDPDRIRQVISNLLSNAIKFTPVGGSITVRILDRTLDRTPSVELSVQDSGCGISHENLPHVFERFWQADSGIDRKHEGMGLGLSIVRQIVEMHNGSINVSSDGLGKGSIFTVSLPATVQATPAGNSTRRNIAPRELSLVGKNILLVDDSLDSLDLLSQLLKRTGASVCAKSSAREALQEAEQRSFDLLISDIGMPEIDGYSFMRLFREYECAHGKTKISTLALTGYASEKDAQMAKAAGFNDHLTKPLDFERLLSAIDQMLNHQRSTKD